jgi:hypothetical protein
VLVFIEQEGLAGRIRLTLLSMSLEFGVFGRLGVVSWNQKPHINWDCIRGVDSKCEYLVDECCLRLNYNTSKRHKISSVSLSYGLRLAHSYLFCQLLKNGIMNGKRFK